MRPALFLLALPALAQVLPFNEAGVTMGHHHLMVPDVAAQMKIWVDVLGGQPSGNPPLQFVKFPGTFLIVSQGNTTQGSGGSALDHFTFTLKDFSAAKAKLTAAGVKVVSESKDYMMTEFPAGIRVEFYEDAAQSTPVAHLGMHFYVIDLEAERAWWAKAFGAQENKDKETFIPGSILAFKQADAPTAKTQGRALNHTGVGVKNVNEYCEKLAGLGIMCERAGAAPLAMVYSPAGVRVEINQGLENR